LAAEKTAAPTPAAHQVLAQEIRGSELVMIEGAAHFTPLERPELLQQWLTR
jgi:pimeloyl-ACP methyl ester carboxylesterase